MPGGGDTGMAVSSPIATTANVCTPFILGTPFQPSE